MFNQKSISVILLVYLLSGCATLAGRDSPDVRIVGLEPLPTEGLEIRFALKMRVINPNDTPINFDGLSVRLDLDGSGLASGVSDVKGEIPRFSEQVLTLPVSISALSAARQLFSRATAAGNSDGSEAAPVSYSLSGKLGNSAGGGALRFSSSGELDIFSAVTENNQLQD